AVFQPHDKRVSDLDGRMGRMRPKLMERDHDEFIIYHPNAAADGHAALVDKTKTARLRIDLQDAPGRFQVEWFRPLDGVIQKGAAIKCGAVVELTAPWQGQDVVVRLLKSSDKRVGVYPGNPRSLPGLPHYEPVTG